MMEKLLTPEDIMYPLSVSRHTLYSWSCHRVNLQPRKIGGLLRYTEEDYERFINQNGISQT